MDYYRPTLELPVGGGGGGNPGEKKMGKVVDVHAGVVEQLSEEIVTVSETCSTFSPAGRCELTPLHGLIMLITSS